MARQGERYNSKTKTGWKWEKGTQVYYHKGKKLNTLQILAKQGKEVFAPLTSGAQTIHDKLRIDPSSPTGESVYTTKKNAPNKKSNSGGSEFKINWRTGALSGSEGEAFHRGSLGITQTPSRIGSGGFGDKYTPTEWLKEELGPTKAEDTSVKYDIPSNPALVSQKSGTNDVRDFNVDRHRGTSTTKPTTTKSSNSRELRIKNFKPSSIQKKLISSGFTPAELVDLQIKHEDWQKNRGR